MNGTTVWLIGFPTEEGVLVARYVDGNVSDTHTQRFIVIWQQKLHYTVWNLGIRK